MTIHELRKLAESIPSQGGKEIGLWLERYAAWVPDNSAIVEMGSWLGSGTAFLAMGAMITGAPIHVYDRFNCASDEEQLKARVQGVELAIGQDTLPLVRAKLDKFPVQIHWHQLTFRPGKAGIAWNDKVGLYVDDLTKTDENWEAAMKIFQPFFIHGETVLILMDFHFDQVAGWAYGAQRRWATKYAADLEIIGDLWNFQSVRAFRYL